MTHTVLAKTPYNSYSSHMVSCINVLLYFQNVRLLGWCGMMWDDDASLLSDRRRIPVWLWPRFRQARLAHSTSNLHNGKNLKAANMSNPNLKYLWLKKNKSCTVLCSCPSLLGTEGYQKACKVFLNFIWPRPSRCSTTFLSPPSTLCRQSQARVRLI